MRNARCVATGDPPFLINSSTIKVRCSAGHAMVYTENGTYTSVRRRALHPKLCPSQIGEFFLPYPVDVILTRRGFNENLNFGFVPSKPLVLGYSFAIFAWRLVKANLKLSLYMPWRRNARVGGIATLFLNLDTRKRRELTSSKFYQSEVWGRWRFKSCLMWGIQAANRCYYANKKLLSNKLLSYNSKI